MHKLLLITLCLCQTACFRQVPKSAPDQFFNALSELCGQAFAGRVISSDPQDADWVKETLIMHVRDCSAVEIKIPLHVGHDRSRTWIISKTKTGLQLKHDHRHADGKPDILTFYGGKTDHNGTAQQQAFPADPYSKKLFEQEGLNVSIDNIWKLELQPTHSFTYELSRPNRDFRAQFDLSNPVGTPPPAWGHK